MNATQPQDNISVMVAAQTQDNIARNSYCLESLLTKSWRGHHYSERNESIMILSVASVVELSAYTERYQLLGR